MSDDKRKKTRQRTYKRVKFTFNNSTSSVNCLLRNKSETGALLDFGNSSWVPNEFRLYDELEGYCVDCRIVRRIGNTAGVEFVGEIEKINPSRKQTITVSNNRPYEPEDESKVAYSIYPAKFGKRNKAVA